MSILHLLPKLFLTRNNILTASQFTHRYGHIVHTVLRTQSTHWVTHPMLSLSLNNYNNVIALSHIYTYMNLGLFTNIAFTGTLETYLQICPWIWFAPNTFQIRPVRFLPLAHPICIPSKGTEFPIGIPKSVSASSGPGTRWALWLLVQTLTGMGWTEYWF